MYIVTKGLHHKNNHIIQHLFHFSMENKTKPHQEGHGCPEPVTLVQLLRIISAVSKGNCRKIYENLVSKKQKSKTKQHLDSATSNMLMF